MTDYECLKGTLNHTKLIAVFRDLHNFLKNKFRNNTIALHVFIALLFYILQEGTCPDKIFPDKTVPDKIVQ